MTDISIPFIRPKSVLHYWLQLAQEPNHDFIRLLDFLSERDLGLLDIALSERLIRKLYTQPLTKYYSSHEIAISSFKHCRSHLNWIVNRDLHGHIQKLQISYSRNIPEELVDFKTRHFRFPRLLEIRCWQISKKFCCALSWYSPNLRYFKIIGGTYELSDDSIDALCAGCIHLKYIEITEDSSQGGFCRLTGASVSSIFEQRKELEVLVLGNWGNLDLSTLDCSALSTLRVLDIDYPRNTSPDRLHDIFASNSRLETVKLTSDLDGPNLPHDAVMTALGAHCHLLKHVTLYTCYWDKITDAGIVAMIQGCPSLETIDIASWNAPDPDDEEEDEPFVPTLSVTNAAMYAIAQYCPNLVSFKINSSIHEPLAYDDTGLGAIVQGCPHLRVIYRNHKVYYAAPGVDTAVNSYYTYYREFHQWKYA